MSRLSLPHPRTGARLAVLLVVAGWLAGGLHHVIVDHDPETGALDHACSGGHVGSADADRDAGLNDSSGSNGPAVQAASTGESHACAIAFASERAPVEGGPQPGAGFAQGKVAPALAPSSRERGGEPLYRLAP